MFEDDKYGSADRDSQMEGRRTDVDFTDQPVDTVRGWWLVSWLFILALVGTMIFLRDVKVQREAAPPALDDSPATMQGISELQLRMLIGFGEFIRQFDPKNEHQIRELYEGPAGNPAAQREHQKMWSHGTFGQRLQFAIAAGELVGPKTALEVLGKLKWDWQQSKLEPSAEQLTVFHALRKTYQDFRDKKYDAPSVKDPERETLLSRLGWYGRLALTPPQALDRVARSAVMIRPLRLVYGVLAVFGGAAVLGLLGTVGLIGFVLGSGSGMLQVGLRPGTPGSGVYAETFVIWMLGFMAGLVMVELWPRQDERLLLNLMVFFGSLVVLVWPVLRGIPWQQVRSDLGLTWGRLGLLEPLAGIPGYIMMLPLLAVGFGITLVLIILSGGAGGADAAPQTPFEPQHFLSHPAVEVLMRGGFWLRLQLMLLACVAAPIVEEIIFRGLLYRQVRDATRGFGWMASCVISALWVSFIFAAIHPQGLLAVPALMGIACGCSLVREWRDSIWASMVVHAINNGLVFTLLILASA